jgi:hypothetical protein
LARLASSALAKDETNNKDRKLSLNMGASFKIKTG